MQSTHNTKSRSSCESYMAEEKVQPLYKRNLLLNKTDIKKIQCEIYNITCRSDRTHRFSILYCHLCLKCLKRIFLLFVPLMFC